MRGRGMQQRAAIEVAAYQAWRGGLLAQADPKKYPPLDRVMPNWDAKPAKAEPQDTDEMLAVLETAKAAGAPITIRKVKG